MIALPIDPFVDAIVDSVRRMRAAVVTAAPGAGKTTRVPPALVGDGPVILLQPRRVAARAIASRIAVERGWTLGREVGWQIRFDRKFTAQTRLLVVTEGVLTARLQTDPLLSDFRTIILDEFHERSIHADLAIALAKQAWRARADLRIVVMSATLDATAVSRFLDGCPVVDVPGRTFDVDIAYRPGQSVVDAADEVMRGTAGQVLCFLPGAAEIHRTMADIRHRVPADVEIVALHGSLDAAEQDLAVCPSSRRRIVVATNIAETSLTVPGVTAVVDTGLQKVARHDADRGIDSLEIERITADAAAQRAGRAGRVAPGVVRRLWDARDRLRPHREPEIHRVDLAAAALDVIAWGSDPRALEWLERPGDAALDAALALLVRLGLIRDETAAPRTGGVPARTAVRLTELGEQVRRVPLHPRLARILIAGGGAPEIARACALLSERHLLPPRTASTSSDLLSAIDDWPRIADRSLRLAEANIHDVFHFAIRNQSAIPNRSAHPKPQSQSAMSESDFRRAIFAGYPDRVAQRREPDSPRVRLASGAGAAVAPESGVRDGEFLVALDVHAADRSARRSGPADPVAVARIRIASRVERAWLEPTASEVVHRFDVESRRVKATLVERYDALVLAEHPTPADPDIAARLLTLAWIERGPRGGDERLLRRLRFAGRANDVDELVRLAARGARSLDEVRLGRAIPAAVMRDLDREAPDLLPVPSGRHVRLEYGDDGTVSASVRLQEVFGLAETPRIGPRQVPVLFALLAPNGRPVQLTRDLRSFWDRTYREVRKELRGRYPKHHWPEDPWKATPTAKPGKKG